ncbi:hypothetical protein TWF192_008526 [Orbilia oligospora]|uniref:Uncharacterized protein n=1 Tax=Orbilia oligospora TaxID=2813651 RepID=A0A6G1M298_ORBOL|nr:hypothetical protein TWF191_000743 [Orbilia oligospora]KAF3242810.1 hypothetical protein TWF192_008526 [Orbilia oligospora]
MTFVDILVLVGEALVYVLTKLATSLRSGVAQLRSPTAPLPSLPTTLSATQTSTSTDENATVGGMGGGTPASRPGADESRNNTQSYDSMCKPISSGPIGLSSPFQCFQVNLQALTY